MLFMRDSIVLPRIDSPAADMTGPAGDELIEGHGETIILVEDDRQVRAVIASMLEALRYNVVQVADGQAVDGALGLHKSSVRLVILDMDLPKASGLACLRRIRKGRPAIPVIVIGGLLDRHKDEIKDDAVLLPKPFPMSKLASLVNRSLADAPSGEQTDDGTDKCTPS